MGLVFERTSGCLKKYSGGSSLGKKRKKNSLHKYLYMLDMLEISAFSFYPFTSLPYSSTSMVIGKRRNRNLKSLSYKTFF